MKGIWRAGTAIVVMACACAAPALASEAADNASSPAAAPAPDQGGATETGSQTGLQEIVVTAQRRSEKLQNVPIAITAANAEALAVARVDNVSNIAAISPSVNFRVSNIASSSATLVIRGLGTTGTSRSFEGSVGVFIDGVYRSRAGAALQDFLDIDNLQVLRGPQGTLFGKNTTAGALLLTSAKPSFSGYNGRFEAGYGNYDSYIVRGAVNAPLGENLAFRISGLASGQDGFYKDVNTGRDLNDNSSRAVKGQLLFEPSSSLSVRLIGDYSSSHGACCYAAERVVAGPTSALVDGLTQLGGLKLPSTDPSKFEVALNTPGHQAIKDWGFTLMVDAALGAGTLKSVSAYRRYDVVQTDEDADFSGADILRVDESFHSEFISQELTYNTRIPALNADIVLGGFIADERLRMGRSLIDGSQAQTYWDGVLGASGFPAGTVNASPGTIEREAMHGSATSYAGFAHADFKVNDKFNIIAGIRYSIEHKTGSFGYAYQRGIPNDVFTVLGVFPAPAYDASHTDRAVSGTFGLQYHPTRDVMLYATYNRGFKAGGVNIDQNGAGTLLNNATAVAALPAAVRYLVSLANPGKTVSAPLDPTYRPEEVNAFEVGAKTQYFNHRARTNIAFYYYDISDLQIGQFVGLRFTVLNAKSAKDYGLEIENAFQVNKALTLNADATWIMKASYAVDPNIDAVLSGSRFRYAPKLTLNLAANVDTPLTDKLDLVGRVQYQYTSSQFINTAGSNVQGPVSLVNANLGVKVNKRITVEGWVQNLFNKSYMARAIETSLQTGTESAYMGAPRTYGIRIRGSF